MSIFNRKKKIRFGVVGLGYISQIAVLPAFKNAKGCELAALVSEDKDKLKTLGRKYGVKNLYSYEQYDELLRSGKIDAVYIALPNHLHRDYTVRAAEAGIHVLCEKPMAVTSAEAEDMIQACQRNRVKLMIAYRLHFEEGNLEAIDVLKSGRIGEPRVYNSTFSMPIQDRNIRTNPRGMGGGPVFDIGIYCINATRYLFQDEPIEAVATPVYSSKKPYRDIEESMSVTLKFPGERIASFVCSYGAASANFFEVVGTSGELCLENSFEFAGGKELEVTVGEKKSSVKKIPQHDQFAPLLQYFAEKIATDGEIEPSGFEGLADLRVIEAIFKSADQRRPIRIHPVQKELRPGLTQEINKPAIKKPKLIKAQYPSRKKSAA